MSDWLSFVKGLTLANVLVIMLLVLALIPAYFFYKLLGDPALLDRFLSHYTEIPSQSDCTIREARERGGPNVYSISQGFAFQGADRWSVAVLLDHKPDETEVASYCAAVSLIIEKMQQ